MGITWQLVQKTYGCTSLDCRSWVGFHRFWLILQSRVRVNLFFWRRLVLWLKHKRAYIWFHLTRFLALETTRYRFLYHYCWHLLLPSSFPWLIWLHSLACNLGKKDGRLRQQNDDFIDPINFYKTDHRANHCYFQIFYGMNFPFGEYFSRP